jgi:hypothetical protein
MEKLGQVNVTTLAIGGAAILGIGYVLATNNFFSSENIAQVGLLVASFMNSNPNNFASEPHVPLGDIRVPMNSMKKTELRDVIFHNFLIGLISL